MDMIRSLLSAEHAECEHVPEQLASPTGNRCEECGSTWNLRMCATCGHVGCCDSQAGDARHHYRDTGHEVMLSMPVEHGFTWCYKDNRYI